MTLAAMPLFECLGKPLGAALAVTGVLVVWQYWRVTRRWIREASDAGSERARWIWLSVAWIFRLCAFAGYGMTVVAIWWPDIAYRAKLALCIADIIACEMFLKASAGFTFIATKREQHVRKRTGDILHRHENGDIVATEAIQLIRETMGVDQ